MQSSQMGRKEEDGNICEMCMRNQKIKTRKVSKGNIGLVSKNVSLFGFKVITAACKFRC